VSSRARVSLALAGAVAICAAAAGLGKAVGPLNRTTAKDHGGDMGAMSELGGLAIAMDGDRLALNTKTLRAGHPSRISFRILDQKNRPVTDFDLEHEKRMHFIVIRRDLTGFQHLHPRMRTDGTWSVTAAPLAAGEYRIFADFKSGQDRILGADLFVPGDVNLEPFPRASTIVQAGPYEVTLQPIELRAGKANKLDFTVTRDGRTAQLGTYLGARAHMVTLREGDLGFLHTHAEGKNISMEVSFPTVGRYRGFLQFSAGGAVRTAAFTFKVTR
jgi:hypothetical protein